MPLSLSFISDTYPYTPFSLTLTLTPTLPFGCEETSRKTWGKPKQNSTIWLQRNFKKKIRKTETDFQHLCCYHIRKFVSSYFSFFFSWQPNTPQNFLDSSFTESNKTTKKKKPSNKLILNVIIIIIFMINYLINFL